MDIINIALVVIIVINFILVMISIIGNEKRDQESILYLINVTTIAWWAGSMFFYRISTQDSILLITKILYVSATFIASSFYYFSIIFPFPKKNHLYRGALILILNLALVFFILFSKSIILDAKVNLSGENIIFFGKYYLVYVIYILYFFLTSFARLFFKSYKSIDRTLKLQLLYLAIGYAVAGNIAFVTNLLLPWLGYFKLNWLGQISTIFMAASITYAVTKHRLFNTKVITTELFIFALWVFTAIRTLLSSGIADQITNIVLLILVIIIGLFLIKSVKNEVEQRERIEKLAGELKTANEGQVNLMHIMNHQIKGRLGNTRNIFAELMTDDYGKMPELTIPLLKKGLEESEIGVNYVQGILKGISAESGTLPYDMQQMNFKDLIAKIAEQQKDHAIQKKLNFDVSLPNGDLPILGDATQLGEAIKNLIDNSITYTKEGSVHVNLEQKNNNVLFSIKDTGIGLKDSDKQNLFKPGGRGKDSIKVNVNSTGYGLAFVKGVVEAHHGRVWAESEGEGKGSQFYIELPILTKSS